MVAKGGGAAGGVWGWQMQTITERTDQQEPTVQHRDSIQYGDKPQWERVRRRLYILAQLNHFVVHLKLT